MSALKYIISGIAFAWGIVISLYLGVLYVNELTPIIESYMTPVRWACFLVTAVGAAIGLDVYAARND